MNADIDFFSKDKFIKDTSLRLVVQFNFFPVPIWLKFLFMTHTTSLKYRWCATRNALSEIFSEFSNNILQEEKAHAFVT